MNIGQGRNPVTILLEKQSVLKWRKKKKENLSELATLMKGNLFWIVLDS